MTQTINQRLDHLDLVSGLFHELGLLDAVDKLMPKQGEHHLSHGQVVLEMLLNGLGFHSRTLHMFSDFFEHKPLERLIGDGVKAEHFTDDALGRTLDALYDNNVSAVFQSLAAITVKKLGLKANAVHLDTTSFHVDGDYKQAEDEDINIINLVRGYSRDHRPELNQVILKLICENQAGLPIYMQALSGNTNDAKEFQKITRLHIKS